MGEKQTRPAKPEVTVMSSSGEQILKDALALPPQERAALLERLLMSFRSAPDPDLEELWLREAEERLDAYDRGELQAVPVEEVIAIQHHHRQPESWRSRVK